MAGVMPLIWNQSASRERARPMNVARLSPRDGAVLAVVDHAGGPLIRSRFQKVNSEPPFTAQDAGSIHAEPSQFGDYAVGQGVLLRQHRDESRLHSQGRERDRNVGLRASQRCHESGRLEESLEARRSQPQHDSPNVTTLLFTSASLLDDVDESLGEVRDGLIIASLGAAG